MNFKSISAAVAAITLTACTGVSTTNGYLNATEKALPSVDTAKVGKIVFIREGAANPQVPTVYINERVVGSLVPNRFSETWLCAGDQDVRIGTRTQNINAGQSVKLNAQAGQVYFVQVSEAGAGFQLQQLSAEQAQKSLKDVEQSHIIDRHPPECAAKKSKQINLQADGLFVFDTATLLPAGQASVNKLIADIKSYGVSVQQIKIVGHTDRLGSDAYNDRLSLARAQTVANALKSSGLNIATTTAGRGEREPVTTSCVGNKATPALVACLQADRRVSIDLVGVSAE